MSKADQILKAETFQKIIEIAENYNSWSNLESSKLDFAEEVLDILFNYGLDME